MIKAFEIRIKKSDRPYLVIASDFGKAVTMMLQKGISSEDFISVQELDAYYGGHILHEFETMTMSELRKDVHAELQKTMPRWMPEPNGGAGGAGQDTFLIRTSKGHYFISSYIGGNRHYLVLDTLEQLPGLPKED